MASGVFSRGKDRISETAETVEEQIADLRDQISELARVVARDVSDSAGSQLSMFRSKARQARENAPADLEELIASGEEILAELTDRYRQTGREMRRTVREHPVATLGAAAIVGFVIAAFLRR